MVTLYRKFGRVWYYIYFDTHTNFDPTANGSKLISEMKAGTGTPMHLFRKGEPSVEGERPLMPTFILKRRVNRLIDALPFTKCEKSEIRSNIKISYETGLHLFF
jgi:hypothetical protein